MTEKARIFYLKNLLTYLGCLVVGIVCSLFLDFSIERDSTILFLTLLLSGIFISYLTEYTVKNKQSDPPARENKPVIMFAGIFLVFRWFPSLFPKSVVELVIFLTFLFLLIVGRRMYVERKAKTSMK